MMRFSSILVGAGLLALQVGAAAHAADEAAPSAKASALPAAAAVVVAPAAPAPKPKPETTLAIDIDLTHQRLMVTEYGKPAGSWAISSGREGYRSPTGSFRPLWLARMWFSKKYDNAPMPHAVFFSGGVAMHATQATGMLGHPASHGCIRQSPANAATMYRLVEKHGNAHTKIVVHGAPHDDEPRVARGSGDVSRSMARATVRPAEQTRRTYAMAPAGMRRVILVDGYGNRHIAAIAANDPRLIAYQRRVSGLE